MLFSTSRPLGLLCLMALPAMVWAQPEPNPVPILPPAPITIDELIKETGGPTLITFQGTGVPLSRISELLFPVKPAVGWTPMSNESAVIAQKKLKPVKVDWNQVPFWQAVKQSEALSGSKWDVYEFSHGLYPGDESSPSRDDGIVAAENPLMKVVANSLQHWTSRAVLATNPRDVGPKVSEGKSLKTSFFFDPKLKIKQAKIELKRILGADGKELAAHLKQDQGAAYLVPNSPFLETNFPLDFPSGTHLANVQGWLGLTLVTKSENFQVPDLQRFSAMPRAVGPVQIVLSQVALNGSLLKFNARVYNRGFELEDLIDVDDIPVFVRDGKGRLLAPLEPQIDGTDNWLNFQFTFGDRTPGAPKLEGPFSLEWSITSEMRDFEMPFELKNLVVP